MTIPKKTADGNCEFPRGGLRLQGNVAVTFRLNRNTNAILVLLLQFIANLCKQLFCGRPCRSCFWLWLPGFVVGLDNHEQYKADNDQVDDRIDPIAPGNYRTPSCLGRFQSGIVATV